MARISKQRNFKMIVGIIMTAVMVISLFAGVGAIWVNETTQKAGASVLDEDGNYAIPKASGVLGTKDNPFVVLEIVPSMNMAQFGYLVAGQEPINIKSLLSTDTARTNTVKLRGYLSEQIDTAHEVIEFSSIAYPEAEDWSFSYKISGSKTKKTAHYEDIKWEGSGTERQYGTFERGTESDHDYVMIEREITTTDPVTYQYSIISKDSVVPGDTVREYYNWKGKTYSACAELTSEQKASYELFEKTLESRISDDDLKTKEYKTIKSYLEGQVYRKGHVNTLASEDLFKKYALGIAYKNGDITKGEDSSSYEFKGWYKDKYGVNEFTPDEKITSSTTLYAKWFEETAGGEPGCEVVFHTGLPDGVTVENMPKTDVNNISRISDINKGSKICEPELTPITEGKVFTGWYTEETGGDKFNFEKTSITAQVTDLYAHWENLDSYKFTWDPDKPLMRFTYKFDSNIPTSSKDKVKIKDGTMPANLEKAIAINGRMVTSGGAISQKISLSTLNTPELVKKSNGEASNLVFAGWYLDDECTVEFDLENAQPALESFEKKKLDKVTLYAKWIDSTKKPQYTISFNTNKPASAKSEVTGLANSSITVEHGNRIEIDGDIVTDMRTIAPELKGNIETALNNYKVQVITVTPAELSNDDNLRLIDRANLIVFNEALNADLTAIWDLYADEKLFPKKSTYDTSKTKFVNNDLSWKAVQRVLSKITGMKADGSSISVCPVVYDYSIYENVTTSSTNRKHYNNNYILKTTGGDKSVDTYGYSSNVYKLFLMTQQAHPSTLFNAYVRRSVTGLGSIDNSGNFSGGDTSYSNEENRYWNQYTLVPWNLINNGDYDKNVALNLIGFKNDYELSGATVDKSAVRNRVFVYNYNSSEDASLVKNFRVPLDVAESDISDIAGMDSAKILYYLLKDTDVNKNFDHDLRILDIEPGSKGKDDEYWFWYISRYVPNYTGKTTVRTMSTAEFICNIDDLNSQYDVIYIGTETGLLKKDGTDQAGSSTEFLSSRSGIEDVEAQEYRISVDNGSSFRYENLKLINVVSGMHIDKNYYVITSPPQNYTPAKYSISKTPKDGYWEVPLYNVLHGVRTENDYGRSVIELSRDSFGEFNNSQYDIRLELNDSKYNKDHLGVIYNSSNQAHRYGYPRIFINGVEINLTWVPVDWYGWNITRFYTQSSYIENLGSVACNVSFYIKENSSVGQQYLVASRSAGEITENGQILVPADAVLGGKYLYSHVGKKNTNMLRKTIGLFSNSTGSNDDLTRTGVTSGNDLTFKKYKEIAEFLSAGYPIILGKGLFTADPGNVIDVNKVDSASWMYKLLSELAGRAEGKSQRSGEDPIYWFREDSEYHNSSFMEALNRKTFRIKLDKSPTPYIDALRNKSQPDGDIYINGNLLSEKTLSFKFKIDADGSGGRYKLKLFIDTNADGRYDTETEKLDSVKIYDESVNSTYSADSHVLRAGVSYKAYRDIDDYAGAIPWKLQIVELDEHNNEKKVRDEKTGISAIKVDKKEKIYVLQVVAERGIGGEYKQKNNVYLPTDEEIAYAFNQHGKIEEYNKDYYFTADDLNNANHSYLNCTYGEKDTDWQRKNTSNFYYYIFNLREFDVHFVRINTEKLAQIAHAENPSDIIIGKTYVYNEVNGRYVEDEYKSGRDGITWSDIDMLIIGYADCYDDISDDASIKMIKEFIEGGKTTLFTHDTTSTFNFSSQGAYDAVGGLDEYDTYWGYNINVYLRDYLGMDRFGVMKNRGKYDDVKDIKPADSSGNKTDYSNIKISNASRYDLKYDVPFKSGKEMDVSDASNLESATKKVNGGSSGSRILTQGFTTKMTNDGANYETNMVTKNNNGQIVSYPYTIGAKVSPGDSYSAEDYSIDVALTHSQYYQLNMEDDELVVWYSLYGDDIYNRTLNDGSNNYYIYNKGNVTYSGVGHRGDLSENEYKLFVNTMIASYMAKVTPTVPSLKNTDRSSDVESDYLYIDYDASLSEDAEDKDVPIGCIEVKDDYGNHLYYAKRVYFELENRSIIINKAITVHYYPVVYDGNNRVVLYDSPLKLETHIWDKEIQANEGIDGGLASTETKKWSNMTKAQNLYGNITEGEPAASAAFLYSVPEGKRDTARYSGDKIDNYSVVGVADGATKLDPSNGYYVDIPISSSYYQTLLKDSYSYKLTKTGESTVITSGGGKYDKNKFGTDKQSFFEIEIQIVTRHGREQERNLPLVGTRGVLFMRRGMFTLD